MTVSASVAELFDVFGSCNDPFAVAVVDTVPVIDAAIEHVTAYDTVEFDGIDSTSAMFPTPDLVFPDAPPVAAAVEAHVKPAGKAAATETTGSACGPLFATSSAYVKVSVPATAAVTPSVFVIEMSATGVILVVWLTVRS